MLTGSQSVGAARPAARPEAAPYLVREDLQNNQTQSDKQSGSQSVEHTATGEDVKKVSEAAFRSDSESAEIGSDLSTINATRLQSDTHPDTNTTKRVQLLQVSAVHKSNTER